MYILPIGMWYYSIKSVRKMNIYVYSRLQKSSHYVFVFFFYLLLNTHAHTAHVHTHHSICSCCARHLDFLDFLLIRSRSPKGRYHNVKKPGGRATQMPTRKQMLSSSLLRVFFRFVNILFIYWCVFVRKAQRKGAL